MTIIRLKYIHRVRDRYGKARLYLRRPGHRSIRLPDQKAPDFLTAYQAALSVTDERPTQPVAKTLAHLVNAFMHSGRFKALGPTTQVTYRRLLVAIQREPYANDYVEQFQTVHLRRFVEEYADRPAAANHRIKLFRMLFELAVDDGWRTDNPAVPLKRLKERAEGVESWTDAQIAQFEGRWPSGSVPRLALALLLYTGQRRSDVVRMGPKHLRNDLIEVTQQKTGTSLLIPVHADLLAEIIQHTGGATFLRRQTGAAFTANGFYMRFKAWRAEAELPDGLSPHGLRKAAARRLAEAGCTAHQIAAITGHATLAEVQRYTRAVDQEKLAREAMARMAAVKSKL